MLWQRVYFPYAMDRATEDFAEMMSIYVTNHGCLGEPVSYRRSNRPAYSEKEV